MKLLLYCTKAKPYLYLTQEALKERPVLPRSAIEYKGEIGNDYLNGKVVAECDYEIEEITIGKSITVGFGETTFIFTPTLQLINLSTKSCLSGGQIYSYLKGKNGYAIHIKNLHIFDEPRDIVHYGTNIHYDDEGWTETNMLWKAPSRMMEVYDIKWNHYVYIPMQSEEICRILNKEQTIIVRKKVLKEMIK